MSVERIIGIDFGTSTSVIRVKRYNKGQPMGDCKKSCVYDVAYVPVVHNG